MKMPRYATLALALAASAGCDPVEDGDLDLTEEEAAPGEGSPGDTGEEPGQDPEVPDPDQAPSDPFDNDTGAALGELAGMWYGCDSAGTYYDVFFDAGDQIVVRDEEGNEAPGTYSTTATSLTLSVPALGYSETTGEGWVELDHLVEFTLPSMKCHAVSLDHTAPTGATVVSCPSIKYIPEVGWEDNEFHFGEGGDVYRRRWKELSGANDTLYGRIYGVYVTIGDSVYMVFAGEHDAEVFLTGTLTDEGLYIAELEPEKGACS